MNKNTSFQREEKALEAINAALAAATEKRDIYRFGGNSRLMRDAANGDRHLSPATIERLQAEAERFLANR